MLCFLIILEWLHHCSLKVRLIEKPRSPLLVQIRAPHLDARRTLRTPTRRALHFFPCARLCAPFVATSTPHQNLSPLLCFAPLPSRWTLLSKVSVAVRIMIVVVHVGRRLRSLLQLLTLLSGISWNIPVTGIQDVVSQGSLRVAVRCSDLFEGQRTRDIVATEKKYAFGLNLDPHLLISGENGFSSI